VELASVFGLSYSEVSSASNMGKFVAIIVFKIQIDSYLIFDILFK